jgi:hypothetical protein
MLDGHGSEMSRRARETRNRKKDRASIFNKDKKELSRGFQDKIELDRLSIHQKKRLVRKVNQLTKEEQTRMLIIGGISFVTFLIILLISII